MRCTTGDRRAPLIDRNHGRDAADLALGALGTLFWPAWLARMSKTPMARKPMT